MTRLPWLIAAVMAYEALAVHNRNVPTISEMVRSTRRHFYPHCPLCGEPFTRRRSPQYRGFLKDAR